KCHSHPSLSKTYSLSTAMRFLNPMRDLRITAIVNCFGSGDFLHLACETPFSLRTKPQKRFQ
ncbi:hypothetical protein M1146_05040, partial [Patescibacteria group bacterium]|nr:hypothetical protein [Patescibacteria group bacterium]